MRGRALAILAGTALLAPALVALPAAAEPISVTLEGAGYGHGRGMSQYGAKGRADAGQTVSQIISFYYPGTTLGSSSDTMSIRVWIRGITDNQTIVRAESDLAVRTPVGRVALPASISDPVDLWRLRLVSGELVAEGRVAGEWRVPASAALDTILSGADYAQFEASDGTVQLLQGSVYREHRGAPRATRLSDSTTALRTVVVIPMGDYLRSVVKAEMPASWAMEAVKAQAVAARSYARWDAQESGNPDWYDTCDTTQCQVYRGAADYDSAGGLVSTNEHSRSDSAVAATAGQIVTSGGAPAFTQFSASNGGYSVAGSRPYLVAQPDPFDKYAHWTVTLTARQIEAVYPAIGAFSRLSMTRDGNGLWGGRTVTVTVVGTQSSVSVSGDTFRSAFGLKSTLWRSSAYVLPVEAPQREWNTDRIPDLVARDTVGRLYVYPGNGHGGFGSRVEIGHGWQALRSISAVANWRGDTKPGLIAVRVADGALMLYSGTGAGRFSGSKQIGHGWGGLDLVLAVQGWEGPGTVGVIARDASTGALRLYSGNGRGGFSGMRQIGSGWTSMDQIVSVGDWDGDGNPDLVARHASTGETFLYPGNGRGGFRPRTVLGADWGGLRSFVGGADWDNDGRADLIAIDAATGDLWLYPSDGLGGVQGRVAYGHGWQSYDLVA